MWLPPLRYSLPVIMLVSGLVLICVETALFLAFQERHAIDSVMERATRDGARIARTAGHLLAAGDGAALERELAATRRDPGLVAVELRSADGNAAPQSEIVRSASGSEIVAGYPVPGALPPRMLRMTFDLAAPLAGARRIAWTQALVTASVLGLGALLLWIALDSAVAARAARIVAGARAMSTGAAPGPPIEGDDELAEIDHALRDAHALIHQQAADLSERARERSRLEQEIIRISEREQRRIGQDLHDDVCQRLAAVKMKIQDHEEKLASVAPALMADAKAIAGDLAGAIHVTRSLVRGLSPVEIESGGLALALKALVRSSRDVFGIDCLLEADEVAAPALPHQTAIQLYRIAQECIANAARHARSTRIVVTLVCTPEVLTLCVANDGAPMPASDAAGNGMGISIMRHRAESIGATLGFDSAPAGATTAVSCTLPTSLSATPPLSNTNRSPTSIL